MKYAIVIILCIPYLMGASQAISSQKTQDDPSPLTYALIVGISNYPYVKPLNYPDKDAELFRDFLLSKAGGDINPANVTLLTNENATAGHFQSAFQKIFSHKGFKKGDRVFIYFSGQGDAIKDINEYYLLLYDCQPAGDPNNYMASMSVIDMDHLKKRIRELCKQGVEVVLIVDASRANDKSEGYTNQVYGTSILEKNEGEILMLATSAGQVSLESPGIGNGHGLFTYSLIDGLSGHADNSKFGNHDGKTDLNELKQWVAYDMEQKSKSLQHKKQSPVFCCTEKDHATIANVDTTFNSQWEWLKNSTSRGGITHSANNLDITRENNLSDADTVLIALYNGFKAQKRAYNLLGSNGAVGYYEKMVSIAANSTLTNSAREILAADLIDFCQEKINLYLSGKDNANDISMAKSTFNNASSPTFLQERGQKIGIVYKTEFGDVAKMLEKVPELLTGDSKLPDLLAPKIYFLLLKDYYQQTSNNDSLREKARELTKKAWTADSKAAYISQAIALFYEKNRIYDTAKIYIRNAIKLAPKWAYPKNHLGLVYYKLRQYGLSGKYFLAAIHDNPVYMEPYFNYGLLAEVPTTKENPNPYFGKYIELPDNEDVELYVKYGRIMQNSFYPNGSSWFFEKAAKKFEQLGNPIQAAFYHSLSGKTSYAKKILVQKIHSNELKEQAYYFLGKVYQNEGNNDSAIYCYQKNIELNPKNDTVYSELAWVYFSKGDNSKAIDTYKKDISLVPNEPWGYRGLIYVYKKINRWDSVIYYAKLGVLQTNKKALFYAVLAEAYDNYKNDTEITKHYVDSAFIEIEQNRNSYIKLDDLVFEKSELIEKNVFSYLYLIKTRLLIYSGDYPSLLQIAQKGLEFDNTNDQLYENLGYCYSKLEKYDSAIYYYKTSIHYNDKPPERYYNLACIYSILNKTKESLYHLEKALIKGLSIEDMKTDADLANVIKSNGFKELEKKYKKP